MYSIAQVEQGLARYIDAEVLPALPHDGLKGFGVGVGATLLVKRCGALLQACCQHQALQAMALVTAEGMVDVDALRDACRQSMPAAGLPVALPMGLQIRLQADDIDKIHQYIKEAGV